MSKSWQVYAQHILDTIEKLYRIKARGSIANDEVLYDATLRNLQTLSEATQKLPENLTLGYPDFPWKSISGFRNILVHNYLGDIDAETVNAVLDTQIEPLQVAITQMLTDDRKLQSP